MFENVVARDGIEPPTPAFSGPLANVTKIFRVSVTNCTPMAYRKQLSDDMGCFGLLWAP